MLIPNQNRRDLKKITRIIRKRFLFTLVLFLTFVSHLIPRLRKRLILLFELYLVNPVNFLYIFKFFLTFNDPPVF